MGGKVSVYINDIGAIKCTDKTHNYYDICMKSGEIYQVQINNNFQVGRIKLAIGQKSDLNWSKDQQEIGHLENQKGDPIILDDYIIYFNQNTSQNTSQNSNQNKNQINKYIDEFLFISQLDHKYLIELSKYINDLHERKISFIMFQEFWKKTVNRALNETRQKLNLFEGNFIKYAKL